MPSVLPLGDPAPSDGLLPAPGADGAADRAFGLYVHIPFCAVRCGYCDFNTYTATELGGGASQDAYAAHRRRGGRLRRRRPGGLRAAGRARSAPSSSAAERPRCCPPRTWPGSSARAIEAWGLEPGAEVTTEANPDSVTPESLQLLADAGFTRVSFGMQSAVPHVLKVLDRTHTPSRVPQVVQWAREAGLAVSLDLIYGTPGESLEDWRYSLETALSYAPGPHQRLRADHRGRHQARRPDPPRRGPGIDDDDHADKYELADELHHRRRASAGTRSATGPARRSRPAGTTSPTGAGTTGGGSARARTRTWAASRWWNVKHPTAYAQPARRRASRRRPAGKPWTPKPATWSGSCSRPG